MSDEGQLKRLGLRDRFSDVLLMASRASSTLARALAIVVFIHVVWLIVGSSLYQSVTSDNDIKPEVFGCTTDANDWLAHSAGLAIRGRSGDNNSRVSALVDRGVSRHHSDDYTTPEMRYKLFNSQDLVVPQTMLTARGHHLRGDLF